MRAIELSDEKDTTITSASGTSINNDMRSSIARKKASQPRDIWLNFEMVEVFDTVSPPFSEHGAVRVDTVDYGVNAQHHEQTHNRLIHAGGSGHAHVGKTRQRTVNVCINNVGDRI